MLSLDKRLGRKHDVLEGMFVLMNLTQYLFFFFAARTSVDLRHGEKTKYRLKMAETPAITTTFRQSFDIQAIGKPSRHKILRHFDMILYRDPVHREDVGAGIPLL